MGIREVAEQAGVSISTVSRVSNDSKNVSGDLKDRVEAAIEKLQYTPNSIAQGLKASQTNRIAVIITSISRTFFTAVLEGIEEEAAKHNYSIMIAETHDDIDKEIELVNAFAAQWVDGIIIASSANGDEIKVQRYVEHLGKLEKKDGYIPVVTLEFPLDNPHIDAVVVDAEKAAYDAVSYLIETVGCKNIVHISIPLEHYLGKRRLDGYKRALNEHQMVSRSRYILEGDYTTYFGYKAVRKLVKEGTPFDGIFCANDQMAVGALKACEAENLRVPEDVAIIGNDDLFVASLVTPSLSSICVRKKDMGIAAMQIIHEAIASGSERHERQIKMLDYEIMERETTRQGARQKLQYLDW